MSDHVFCQTPALLILLYLYLRQVPSLSQPAHVIFRDVIVVQLSACVPRNMRVVFPDRCRGAILFRACLLKGQAENCYKVPVAFNLVARLRSC